MRLMQIFGLRTDCLLLGHSPGHRTFIKHLLLRQVNVLQFREKVQLSLRQREGASGTAAGRSPPCIQYKGRYWASVLTYPACAGIPSESEDRWRPQWSDRGHPRVLRQRCDGSYQQVLHHFDLLVDVVEDFPAAFCTLLDLLLLHLVLWGIRAEFKSQ